MLASVAHSHHSVLANSGACSSFSRAACCETGLFGLSVAFWFLFALTLDREVLILTSGVHCVITGRRLGGGGGGGGDNHVWEI